MYIHIHYIYTYNHTHCICIYIHISIEKHPSIRMALFSGESDEGASPGRSVVIPMTGDSITNENAGRTSNNLAIFLQICIYIYHGKLWRMIGE